MRLGHIVSACHPYCTLPACLVIRNLSHSCNAHTHELQIARQCNQMPWPQAHLRRHNASLAPRDIQSTCTPTPTCSTHPRPNSKRWHPQRPAPPYRNPGARAPPPAVMLYQRATRERAPCRSVDVVSHDTCVHAHEQPVAGAREAQARDVVPLVATCQQQCAPTTSRGR